MEFESKQDILRKRREIEKELLELLAEQESEFDLDYIKEVIYNEEEQDDMIKIVAIFDDGSDISHMEYVLDLVTDAWNYFPHKIIGGLSPAEQILEHNGGN